MWPYRSTPRERRTWIKRLRRGETPPYAPPLVQRYPERAWRFYAAAWNDGYDGTPPKSVNPLYRRWYAEGKETRELAAELERLLPLEARR
jgi:hypothetical protein